MKNYTGKRHRVWHPDKKKNHMVVGRNKTYCRKEEVVIMTNKLKAGNIITYGGMDWVVLDCNKDEVFVLAKESIGFMPFDKNGSNDFVGSTLFAYLNGEFIKELEANGADTSAIPDEENGIRVALLSVEEYVKYEEYIEKISDWWWLRTPGYIQDYAAYVDTVGSVYRHGLNVDFGYGAVRPVMWLKRSAIEVRK